MDKILLPVGFDTVNAVLTERSRAETPGQQLAISISCFLDNARRHLDAMADSLDRSPQNFIRLQQAATGLEATARHFGALRLAKHAAWMKTLAQEHSASVETVYLDLLQVFAAAEECLATLSDISPDV